MTMTWIEVEDQKPEKETPVIVCVQTDEAHRYCTVAEYIPPKTVLSENYLNPDFYINDLEEYDEKTKSYFCCENWFQPVSEYPGNFVVGGTVTHWMPWMPLPETK